MTAVREHLTITGISHDSNKGISHDYCTSQNCNTVTSQDYWCNEGHLMFTAHLITRRRGQKVYTLIYL